MAEAINSPNSKIQQLRQQKTKKKRELTEQQNEDLKALKERYAQENRKLDEDNKAAVSHIKAESEQAAEEERATQSSHGTYNRQGRAERTQSKPLVQNYQTKETDQFYHVQDRGSRVSESSTGYVIEAYAPEHEKDNLRFAVENNRAVLSGKRKFNDSIEQENKKIDTNNFQTYREEFKFDRPVTTHGMTREREGDYIRFFIPKLESVDFDEKS